MLELILAGKLIEVAVSIADLVTMGRIARHPVRILIFTLSVEYVLSWIFVNCDAIDSLTDTHQLLDQLFPSDLLAVDEFLEQYVKLSNVV